MSKKEEPGIGLSEFLRTIRTELLDAQRQADKPIMRLKDIEIEISIATAREAEGGIKFWVVNLGGKYSKERTHTLRLKLTPLGDIDMLMVEKEAKLKTAKPRR